LLGSFGLQGEIVEQQLKLCSGGERSRAALARLTVNGANLLILDEPTNHLDIDAREELLTALNDFEGAVILVSHDRRLIETTADRLWLVANGGVQPFDGDLEDYRRFLLSGEEVRSREEPAPKHSKEEARRGAAERRQKLKPLKDKIQLEERHIAALTAEMAKLDATLADPLLFVHDPAKGSAVSKKRAEAKRKLEAAESRWLAANEQYEREVTESPTVAE